MAISISLDSNFAGIRENLDKVLKQIRDNNDPILLAVSSGVLSLVAYRIHTEGKRPDGSQIGTYNSKYLQLRVSKYNRTTSNVMVYSLTRQMENDFSVVEANGKIGLGFKNIENFKKATYLEEMRPGVYDLSQSEQQAAIAIIEDYINGLFE